MSAFMKIENCTIDDFYQILKDISCFWRSDRTLHLHQPFLIHEFGNTAFVIRDKGKVIAYLFGFISQTENLAYVHLIGVREEYQRKGLGEELYDHFIKIIQAKGIKKIKAITTPTNSKSINFHTKKIGMKMLGEPNDQGVAVVKNYSGIHNDRVVFEMEIN
jgi:predicted GNAT superfamily acetyltransferase